MDWRPTWNLRSIPDDKFNSERGRRLAEKRATPAVPKKLRPCPYCSKEFGAREMRIHVPRCPKRRRT